MLVRFVGVFVEPAFTEKSGQILRMQHLMRFSAAQHLPIQTHDLICVAVNNTELMRNEQDGRIPLFL